MALVQLVDYSTAQKYKLRSILKTETCNCRNSHDYEGKRLLYTTANTESVCSDASPHLLSG